MQRSGSSLLRGGFALTLTAVITACNPAPDATNTAAPAAAPAEAAAAATPDNARLVYPQARTVEQTDEYHGERVADPYRWLEDIDSAETAAWIEAENKVTFDYLGKLPTREHFAKRLTDLWNYERYGMPERRGNQYLYSYNDGLMNQSQIWIQTGLDGEPRVLLDPNTLSTDGTVALSGAELSKDGSLLAYGTSSGGSDWQEWRVRDVATGEDREDHLKWIKFSGATWAEDGSGFWYARYDEPTDENALKAVNKFQKLYFHRLGTPQSEDVLVYERPDQPDWGFLTQLSDDGAHLIINVWRGTENKNLVFIAKPTPGPLQITELVPEFSYSYGFVGNEGNTLYFQTDDSAPRERLIAVDLAKPQREHWREIIPESDATLSSVQRVGKRLLASYLRDATSDLRLFELDGSDAGQIALPGPGSAGASGSHKYDEAFYTFSSYAQPSVIYRLDTASNTSTVFREPKVAFQPDGYETTQVFYTSKDGTRVPMFITHKRGIELNGSQPTLLYGYGGFNIPMTPGFSPRNLAWLEAGGVYAVANLRGGGEYGRDWHQAGTKLTKQNVFDDMAAAAEYLIAQKWTSPKNLALHGGSNGGLLAAAVAMQRPDLFAATVPAVGVLDMLRFRDFTIGWAWESDYGSVLNADEFKALHAYSPLHNLKEGVDYPAFLITTGDHDDRVFPAHSFKFAAALQAVNPPRPALIRVDVRAGHGAGKPIAKQIEEAADVLAFIAHNTGLENSAAK